MRNHPDEKKVKAAFDAVIAANVTAFHEQLGMSMSDIADSLESAQNQAEESGEK